MLTPSRVRTTYLPRNDRPRGEPVLQALAELLGPTDQCVRAQADEPDEELL